MTTHNARTHASHCPTARTEGLVVQNLHGETLVYDEQTHKALCLNETASLIWAACDGRTDVAGLKRKLERLNDAPIADEVVWLGLDQLTKQGLLKEIVVRPAGMPSGVSRRAALRTLGITAAIAIPTVTAIIAPTAAQAATGGAPGSGCTPGSTTQCQTGVCPPSGLCGVN
ncbi:MAG: PqqD family protein [Pyrinomonadaceae bacterium MAG19_C2-C3]|nr:PqqD family protein [Pyrinomonadaceae bacterium MAG19_C2-C3]